MVDMNVYGCEDCSLHFLEAWDDEECVYQFYDNNNYVFKPNVTGEKRKFDEYGERMKRISPYITSDIRLLDIGCGDGTFLRNVRPYVKVAEGVEIVDKHIKNLREEGFKIWDCFIQDITVDMPYDIICMFALLEHIPKVTDFLEVIKTRFIHEKSQIFIEVPNLQNPMVSCYDIPEFRDFFYRQYHLYYFTEKSLARLLKKVGFQCEYQPLLQASITNHFHWMHQRRGQATTTDMSNVVLPNKAIMGITSIGQPFMNMLEQVDDFYRELMLKNGIGDLISCRAWI